MSKKQKRETKSIPPLIGVATLDAETADAEARTVEMTFYSGAPVFRFPMFDDPYELEFEVSKKAANLDRLNAGASLINSHNTYDGVEGILGVVEKAWLSDGMGHARVRFSARAEVQPIFQDVLDGIIRNVSMGTYIQKMEEVTEKGAEMKRFRATSWQPYEISLVSVPADPGANILQAAADAVEKPCSITYRAEAAADAPQEGAMKLKVRLLAESDIGEIGDVVEIEETEYDETLHSKELAVPPPPPRKPSASPDDPNETARSVDAAIARDNAHAEQLKRVAEHYNMDSHWTQRHINLNTSIKQAIADASRKRAGTAPNIDPSIQVGDDRDNAKWRVARMGEALAARAKRTEPPKEARQYADTSLVESALECLAFIGEGRGLRPRRDANRIVELALHTNSDFPLLLGNVLNKIMLPAYESANPTYRMIAAERTFNDFRAHRFLRSGDFPVPLLVNEHGEYTYGSMSENQETVTLATYGRIIGFTRQSLVNDDLGALEDMATKAGIRTADFENAHFFTTCMLAGSNLGPDLSDAVAVYNAAHGNITGAGALSVAIMGEARALLMQQTSLDGIKLNVSGSILLVAPESLTLAEELTTAITPAVATNVNPFAGRLTAVGDANLTDNTRFYILAEPGRLANYVYGYLGGQAGPRSEVRNGFEVDGVEFKLSLDFAVGAIDYRGGVTGAGA